MLFREIDPRQYAALRIAFGFLGLMTLVGLVGESTFYYSDIGWFPLSMAIKITEKREWTILHTIATPWAIKVFFYAAMAAAVGMIVGFQTRLCTFLLWASIVSIQSRNWLNTYGGDAVLRLMIFYLGFSRAGAVWSIDSLLRRYREGARLADHRDPSVFAYSERRRDADGAPVWPLRLMQVQICLLYFTTGMAKLRGVEWFDGTAMGMVLANPLFARLDYSFLQKFKFIGWVSSVLTRSAMYWEIFFPLLILNRYTRWVALAIGVGVHMSIIVFFQIHWFGHIMLATYLAFVPNEMFGQAAQWMRIQLRRRVALSRYRLIFDDGDAVARRIALGVSLMDIFRRVVLVPRTKTEQWEALGTGLREHDLRGSFFVTRKGQPVEKGFEALVRLGTRVPLLWPMYLACKVNPLKQWLQRGYAEWAAQQPRPFGPDTTPRHRLRSVN